MLHTRRAAARLVQRPCRRQPHRHDSSSTQPPGKSSGHQESAGHYEPTHHPPHPEPVNESLGRGFYIALGVLPLSFGIYKLSRSADGSSAEAAQPVFTRVINSYSQYKERWTARNAVHTAMVEQAAHDRNLFQSSAPSRHVDLKFPEIFNTGSPYNVPAGQGGGNLTALIAYYEKKNAEHDAAKMKELREREEITRSGRVG